MALNTYFATRTAVEVVSELITQKQRWNQAPSQMGLRSRWRRSFNLYYGNHFQNSGNGNRAGIQRLGEKGELAGLAVNHYRNLIKHTLVLSCGQKPSFDVRAVNTDESSLNQSRLGDNILQADFKQKRVGKHLKGVAERSQVLGKAFSVQLWEPSLGKPAGVQSVKGEDGQEMMDEDGTPMERVVYEGDIASYTLSPYDVFNDQGLEDWEHNEWVDLRIYKNKFNLAAQYPHLKDKIENLALKGAGDDSRRYQFGQGEDSTTQAPIFYFIHKRTHALPNGRMIIYCDPDCVLFDGPAPPPYDEILPVFRIVPGEVFGTTEGYSDAFDLIGIQEAIDVIWSTAFTNIQANGIQKIWSPNLGSTAGNLTYTMLGKGLAILRGDPHAKPEALQLTANPGDIYNQLNLLIKQGETISGINSVARGDPEHSLKSGVALAYVGAMAVQYNSGFQEAWASLNEEVATFRLKLYQHYAKSKRMIALAGKRNHGYMTSFEGSDIDKIDRVYVEVGSPMAKSLAGRIQLAEMMADKKLVNTPQDFLTVIETGQIDAMTEDLTDTMSSIRQENEFLMDGKKVTAIPGEPHILHAKKHLALLDNPEIKNNASMVAAVLAHVQQHVQIKKTEDPIFSMISGEPPLPPPPMPPQPQGPPPPPPGAQPGPGGQVPPPPMGPHPVHQNQGPVGGVHKLSGLDKIMAMQNPSARIEHLPPNLQPLPTGNTPTP